MPGQFSHMTCKSSAPASEVPLGWCSGLWYHRLQVRIQAWNFNKVFTFSHHLHGSGSSLAYLQEPRGTPVNHRGGGGIGTMPSAPLILRSSGDHF
ncbi:hypothetical protein CDAR_487941 [Caerostris darwini]|uniref:Uncharacterized protein n=1 Tax=Caerostris darwini TaxID=1538125 RepID=A0AAV4MF85_9ARAC|nr:hypothetical protein CDAR_487941 [Caerostris darwini]